MDCQNEWKGGVWRQSLSKGEVRPVEVLIVKE